MSRLPLVTTATADNTQRDLLRQTEQQLGRVPNLYAAMANAPSVLRGFLAMRDSLALGELNPKERELLALLVAQENECEYCVSAHTLRGRRMLLTDAELLQARRAGSTDPHTRAVLRLASAAMATQGRVTDTTLAEAQEAGVSDAQITEVFGHVALNILSNYINHLAQPELDFPRIEVKVAAEASKT